MRGCTEDQKEVIRKHYGQLSYSEIGRLIGKTPTQVKTATKTCVDFKVKPGSSKFSRKKMKYSCNEDYFSEMSLESVYWAGFIAADGCIIDSRKTKALRIMLQGRDAHHLTKFLQACNFTGEVKEGNCKHTYKGETTLKPMCYFDIRSDRLCEDLEKFYNITPRKSKTLKPPVNLTDDQKLHFIKGYIDGDGSIGKPTKEGKWDSRVQILGTEILISWIKDNVEVVTGKQLPPKSVHPKSGVISLVITYSVAKSYLKELCKIPYQLERKWKGVEDLCENYKDPRIKLTDEDVTDVLKRLESGEKQKDIANSYGVHQVHISTIKLRKDRFKEVVGKLQDNMEEES